MLEKYGENKPSIYPMSHANFIKILILQNKNIV